MGFGVTELLIILAIVLVLFGAKKLRNIGGDLGGAIKNFKTAMKDEENAKEEESTTENKAQLDDSHLEDSQSEKKGTTIEGTVESKTKENS
ncbi:MAG: Sec-independent protein translocase subunit TatA [Gammaproteobacteria bacterium]|nr:Sec-independent protein translocase subunit TatA [Gammaproteobacteria bacterium]